MKGHALSAVSALNTITQWSAEHTTPGDENVMCEYFFPLLHSPFEGTIVHESMPSTKWMQEMALLARDTHCNFTCNSQITLGKLHISDTTFFCVCVHKKNAESYPVFTEHCSLGSLCKLCNIHSTSYCCLQIVPVCERQSVCCELKTHVFTSESANGFCSYIRSLVIRVGKKTLMCEEPIHCSQSSRCGWKKCPWEEKKKIITCNQYIEINELFHQQLKVPVWWGMCVSSHRCSIVLHEIPNDVCVCLALPLPCLTTNTHDEWDWQ